MTRTKPIIGLCGGIGAGKSRVAAEFAQLGCRVVDSDRLNEQVLRRRDVLATLRGWWGDGVVAAGGRPNRRRIAEIVFADAEQRRRLEGLIHPLIARLREDIIKAVNKNRAVKAVILDSPLLFETNLDRRCDAIVFVKVGRTTRLRRLKQARNWTVAQVRQRERWQMPLARKRSRSQFVVDNEGPPDRIRPQVFDILGKVMSRHAAGR